MQGFRVVRLLVITVCVVMILTTAVSAEKFHKGTCEGYTSNGPLPVPAYCNHNLCFAERARSLVELLTLEEKVGLFFGYPASPFIERFNLKQWSLDHTCIHGINKARNVTVFPHAIAQASTWDVALVGKVGKAIAKEARVLSQLEYEATHGRNQGSFLSCDGGPLANTAHDPRWGRSAETYGEDPHLVQEFGVAAVVSMQNRIPVTFRNGSASSTDFYFETRQVTRHFLGYHVAKPDNLFPVFNVSRQSLTEVYLPVFEAFQKRGQADGIMCAMTMIRIDNDPPFPPCASPYLNDEILRKTWHSDALVQTDCCDSVSTINEPFHYMNISNDREALGIAVLQGNLQNYYGFKVDLMKKNLLELATASRNVSLKVKFAAERVLLSFFRLGFFDSHRDTYPFRIHEYDKKRLHDGKHADLARECASAAIVLLRNQGSVLPLRPEKLHATNIAVIGPFSNCSECHLHSYHGTPKHVRTVLEAVHTAFDGRANAILHEQGSNVTCPWNRPNCWLDVNSFERASIARAVSLSKHAHTTILCLGLGNTIEAEGKDRTTMRLPAIQEELLKRVRLTGTKVILVLVSGSGVDVDESLAHGVLWAPYLGQEAGSAVVDIILGEKEPSGKIPLTFYAEDWILETGSTIHDLNLDADLGRTYRHIREPRFVKHSFGFGLTYTSWRYSDFVCTVQGEEIECQVKLGNIGPRRGYQTTQLYQRLPMPKRTSGDGYQNQYSLVAFKKHYVSPLSAIVFTLRVPTSSLNTPMDATMRKDFGGHVTLVVGGRLPSDVEGLKEVGDCQSYTVAAESSLLLQQV